MQILLEELPKLEANIEGEITRKGEVFEVELVMLHYFPLLHNYQNELRVKKLYKKSVFENDLHLWHFGLLSPEMSSRVDCNSFCVSPTSLLGWKNETNNIAYLLQQEVNDKKQGFRIWMQ